MDTTTLANMFLIAFMPFLVSLGLLGALLLIVRVLVSAQHHSAWRKAAGRLGMTFEAGGLLTADYLRGRVKGYEVAIYTGVRENPKSRTTDTTMEILGGLPAGLRLRSERGRALSKLFAGEDIKVGEKGFDWQALIRGDELEALAVMNAAGRARARELLSDGGAIEDGAIVWSTADVMGDHQAIEARVYALIKIVDRMSIVGRDPIRRLAENAREDPVPGVRLRNLEVLLERCDERQAREHARACVADEHPEVALRAALTLGEEGLPHVERLVTTPGVPQALQVQALKALGARGEVALIEMLRGVGATARAAARALEVCGTAAAVAPLMVLLRDLDTDPVLRDAARAAVAAIQARAGVQAGGFSVVEGDAGGAISLDESDRRGAVSVTREPDPSR